MHALVWGKDPTADGSGRGYQVEIGRETMVRIQANSAIAGTTLRNQRLPDKEATLVFAVRPRTKLNHGSGPGEGSTTPETPTFLAFTNRSRHPEPSTALANPLT